MYVTSDYVAKPKEAAVSIVRRQKIIAAQGRRDLHRCSMEHSIRVSDLKFNERRYHRLLNWLEDVKVRHKRTSQRQPSVVENEKEKKVPADVKSSPETNEPKTVTKAGVSSVFITHLTSDERRDSFEQEQQHYDTLMNSMRKSIRSKLAVSEPLFRSRPIKYPLLNSNRLGSLEMIDKRKPSHGKVSLLPLLQVASLPNQGRRRQLRLSAIPEADLKEEEMAMRLHKKASGRKRSNFPPLFSNKMTPSSTPRSSRTPVLSPISETVYDLSHEEQKMIEDFEGMDLNRSPPFFSHENSKTKDMRWKSKINGRI